jgi:hypothetical protein
MAVWRKKIPFKEEECDNILGLCGAGTAHGEKCEQ